MEYITSRSNQLVTHIRKLNSSRAYRRHTGQFFCEGVKMLEEALRWGARVETVLTNGETALPETIEAHTRLVGVPKDLLCALAATEHPQDLLFLCRLPPLTLPERLTGVRYLVLDGLQDPGNLGTIWRTADAFGADGLFLIHHCADPYAPKTVRATMGAVFRLPVWEAELHEIKGLLDEASIPLCATALRGDALDIRDRSLSPAAVIIGSEGRGVSDEALSLSERMFRIPMTGKCESLNAGVAASIILWEMYR